MRSWMKYSIYITSLVLVALILLPSLALGKPPEDKGKGKDNGNGKPPKTEDKDNGKPPKTKDEVKFVIIESSSGPNGNISPSGSVKVKIGDNQRFKVSANGGYRIKEVVVDDVEQVFDYESKGKEHVRKWEYTIEDVQKSQTIRATFARDVFTIKALARGPGTISPPGAVKVRYGDSQEFSIRATQGFCIDNVQISPSIDSNTLDMDEAAGKSTYGFSFNGVTSDCTIIVTFARVKKPEPDPETDPEPLTIKSEAVGAGSIDPLGEVEVEYGSDQTFTMTPEPCHRISAVLVDDELVVEGLYIDEETGIGTYTFTDVKEDYTINAIFEEITYTIMASAGSEGEGGSIDPSGEVEVVCGSEQTFTIVPDSCHRILEVLVDDPTVDVSVYIDEETGIGTYTFSEVTSDHTIDATFEEVTYTITATPGMGGSIDPSGEVEVVCGSDQTFTITPGPCYSIAEVLVGDPPVAVAVDAVNIDEETGIGTYTFTNVSSDDTIHATFDEITEPYIIRATSDEFGSIDPSGEVEVVCGSDQTFTITPGESCYGIAEVQVDGKKVDVEIDQETGIGTYTFSEVTSDHTIDATFGKTTYTIMASAGDGGSIDPSGGVEVVCGSEQVFTVVPDSCHRILEVLVDDPTVDVSVYIDEETGIGTYTLSEVTSDHTIDATFEDITYTITATPGKGGSIDPSGEVEVVCGSDQTFTITPGPCYSIAEVLVGDPPAAVAVDAVDIDEKTGIGTYTFEDVSSDDTIHATFEEVTEPYTIIATSDEFGSIDPSGEVEVVCGSEQTFTITPGPCYSIAEVLVGDPPVAVAVDAVYIDEETGIGTYTFEDVSSDDTIHATFKKTTYTIKTIAEGNGSIVPSGEVQVECGGSQLFKIRPDEGYTRGSVLINGDPVKTKGNKYEFTDVHSGHTIKVTFVEDLDEDDPKGDVNNDGKVNSGDAIFILLIVTGQIEPTEQQELAADVNGDGVIDIYDALYVLNIVAGLAAPDADFDSALLQNFPNPFNPETWIPFRLSEGSEVTIEIYDATGHLVRRLPLGHKSAGFYTSQERAAYWDGCNEDGERVASGVYFYAIRAANFTDMKKMIIAQ